jgi:hypothetical protein
MREGSNEGQMLVEKASKNERQERMSQQTNLANNQPKPPQRAKRGGKHSHEVVFGSIEAFLAALDDNEVMIAKITQNAVPRGRNTGVTQRHYGVHLTALGPIHGTTSLIYYCTILVASESVFANRSFCPPPQARIQQTTCLKQQEEVYQDLMHLLLANIHVSCVMRDARILVSTPWIEPIVWSQNKDISAVSLSDTSFIED